MAVYLRKKGSHLHRRLGLSVRDSVAVQVQGNGNVGVYLNQVVRASLASREAFKRLNEVFFERMRWIMV